MAALEQVKAGDLTTAAFARRFGMSYNKARYFILTDGNRLRRGPQPFFTAEEEQVLVKYIRINAVIGRGLSRDAFLRVCGEYVSSLSVRRQETARRYFHGTTTPGRGFMTTFLKRWPELREYRAGTIEEGRARNARPKTVAHWYATLSLMNRDLRIVSPRQVCTVPLASFLNDCAVAWRRTPPGFDKSVFDVYAEHIATFRRSYYPKEAKLLAVDGAKVRLSPGGLLTLLRANVHVIAEPSKMSHILQALDTPSAFGRFQPKKRSRVRELALACHADGRPFTIVELVKSIGRAASEALTVGALVSAFRRVGTWPLDPTVVSWEDLCKGADESLAADVDIPLLVSRLAPVARKNMARAVVQNGTLSIAGRATILNALEVISALLKMDADKEEQRTEAEASKRAREKRAAKKSTKDVERARAKRARMEDKAELTRAAG
ncbi:hypothetical protein I4F81_000249 [Pyropia yezoensis]|uniref:Uncharacterized protein n=1 Tax=Pyropia yezoensis TaxID=2788 RepID=A0ACC3BIA9_PYRYE|nr:hypothetical protein I4F81_000249 [Neopyropia yezoensis]